MLWLTKLSEIWYFYPQQGQGRKHEKMNHFFFYWKFLKLQVWNNRFSGMKKVKRAASGTYLHKANLSQIYSFINNVQANIQPVDKAPVIQYVKKQFQKQLQCTWKQITAVTTCIKSQQMLKENPLWCCRWDDSFFLLLPETFTVNS